MFVDVAPASEVELRLTCEAADEVTLKVNYAGKWFAMSEVEFDFTGEKGFRVSVWIGGDRKRDIVVLSPRPWCQCND